MIAKNTDVAKLIELAVQNEEWAFANAAPEDRCFWDGWSADAVRAGSVIASVTTSARGLGHTVIVTARLVVRAEDGSVVATVPDSECTERVGSRIVRRNGGLEKHAQKTAAKLYGDRFEVRTKHHV